ncbi:unnamed protein product [Adineta steineri]|uniref:Uncharacterized protein n=1 Tax=Adineta steineri TaxID=433720 RepID=A0A819YZH1_9BILA|nr:unnamed protein product [Adineta steineri]
MFVLDDADELLARGFKDQIYDLLTMLSRTIQVIVVSSTMSSELLEIAAKFMNDPVKILTKREDRTLDGIRQFYMNVEREECKLDKLYELFDTLTITQTIIFCNTCYKVEWLSEKLRAHNLTVSILNLNMTAEQRNDAIKEFRMGTSQILLRRDRLEADTDIPQVSPIVNYDLPTICESYVRRIGRRGRFGRKGIAINFITNDEQQTLHDTAQHYNTQIQELPTNIADLI